MGSQTRIEDVTLTLTSATSNLTLIGLDFGNYTTSSKLRACVVNVTSTDTNASNVYGIYSNGTTSNPSVLQSQNAIQRTTVNVNSSATGLTRGYYFPSTSSCQFSVRDAVVFANFTGSSGALANVIGVENVSTDTYVFIKTSTVNGNGTYSTSGTGPFDIRQPSYGAGSGSTGAITPSNIILSATDLTNHNADAYGFGLSTEPGNLNFIVTKINGNGTHYLTPGTAAFSDAVLDQIFSIPFMQSIIIFETELYSQTALSGSKTITINLFKSTSYSVLGTQFASLTLNSTRPTIYRLNNFASTFNSSSYLQVQLVTSNISGGDTIYIMFRLGLY